MSGEEMALNQEEKRKHLVDFDDSKSGEGCEDIVDLLPNDPFEMESLPNESICMDFNMKSLPRDPFGMDFDIETAFAAISGWIEDFGVKAYGFETDEAAEDNSDDDGNSVKASDDDGNSVKASDDDSDDDNEFFAELNFVWTSSLKYEQEDVELNEVVDAGSMMSAEDGSYMLGFDANELMCFGCEKYENEQVKVHDDADGVGGDAADVIIFVLEYLGVKDLLSVERVCKSLRDAVRKESYLWREIRIDFPLCHKITDGDLLRLTDRAQGTLRTLSLENCWEITNNGLKRVLESNLGLTKLSLAECKKLKVAGVLHDLEVFNSVARPGIKRLRIAELYGLTNGHLKEFKHLLGADEDKRPSNYKPRFFRAREYLSLDDERAIDIETCPRCQRATQVYDCPSKNCQVKTHSTKTCRACIICIQRCKQCGCCLGNKAYEETLHQELHCYDCLGKLLNFQDGETLNYTYFHQMASCRVFFYG